MSQIPIRRRISTKTFRESFLRRNEPVVLKGYGASWPAVRHWSLSYLAKKSGERMVPVFGSSDYGKAGAQPSDPQVTRLSDYIDYVRAVSRSTVPPGQPLYLRNVFIGHFLPELMRDVAVPEMATNNLLLHPLLAPYVQDNWKRWFELFVSPPRTRFPIVHQDTFATHAWLLQIRGRKRVWAWPPETRTRSRRADMRLRPREKLEEFFKGYPAQKAILEPGDVLFVPAGWWHTAESLSVSITVSGNWVEADRWRPFFDHHVSGKPEKLQELRRRLASELKM
jgi:histone arginine demethylase JMJD6